MSSRCRPSPCRLRRAGRGWRRRASVDERRAALGVALWQASLKVLCGALREADSADTMLHDDSGEARVRVAQMLTLARAAPAVARLVLVPLAAGASSCVVLFGRTSSLPKTGANSFAFYADAAGARGTGADAGLLARLALKVSLALPCRRTPTLA
jgi:hypothetical protein